MDAEIKNAIRNAPAWQYLDEIKQIVCEKLGLTLNSALGYKIYCLNREVENEREQEYLQVNGWQESSQELLANLENKQTQILLHFSGILGVDILNGKIKKFGNEFVFIPKGKRNKGFYPRYIREVS